MKPRLAFISAALTCALTIPVVAQDLHTGVAVSDTKRNDMAGMMGNPNVEVTVEGLHMKVWLISQRHRRGMMKHDSTGINHGAMEMSNATMDSMMAAPYHIGLEVTDAERGTSITSAGVRLLIESPSKKSSSVNLKPMNGHFGGPFKLDEKGEYSFTVSVNEGGVSRSTTFQYTVN